MWSVECRVEGGRGAVGRRRGAAGFRGSELLVDNGRVKEPLFSQSGLICLPAVILALGFALWR